ncbi:peptidylprolyl isomerase [Alteriqipengyuania flavescens]|uniref:peptidylprolyl isomerase n=1 Tax=Alteriqipengyuania flavescens TaxID=3053610 RepID=UPI0025B3B862|nr:peptidylprolyl isomerase [Alteriqipengyuania flavescens]WJY18366.1 peptidylprolyl isomerase [Alteriqipengyuania flavescens]WJY24307.1 peptidylprolyl isomerase [Alteriqipengyuania flavescens]
MIKTLFTSLAALAALATPVAASAQDAAPATQRAMPIRANYDLTQDLDNILYLDLSTGERVAIRLVPEWAPNHVERIKTLTRQGFYDGVIFHRVIDNFMAQTGDPTGTGTGSSSLPDLQAEFNRLPHVRGTVSMARASAEDSANSQFFIVFYPRFSLDQNYTNFGRVISNMDAVDAIERGQPPANPTRILQASIASDNKPQAMPQPVVLPQQAPELTGPEADMAEVPLSE